MRLGNIFLAAVLAVTLAGSGCTHGVKTVSNTPTGVSSDQVKAWYGMVGALDDVSKANHAVFQTMTGLQQSGVWTDEGSYEAALKLLGRIDVLELADADMLQAQPNNWSQSVQAQLKLDITEMLSELASVPAQAAIGVKNANSQAQLTATLAALQQTINLAASFISAAVSTAGATPRPNTGVQPQQ